MAFPTTLDSLNNPTSTDKQGAFGHADLHSDVNDAIEALEAKVGVDNSAVTTSLDYLVKSSSSTNPGHKHPPSAITQGGATLNQALLWNGSQWAPGTPAGGGDVLGPGASVDSEIALYSGTSGTTIKRMTGTGLVKSTSGVASIASPGTDYAPATSGSSILKGNGAGGTTTAVAGTDYVTPTGSETLTNKTLTSPTLTTPVINVGSDANGDMYYRASGTTARLAKGIANQFLTSDGNNPVWGLPFVFSGTLVDDSISTSSVGTFGTSVRQLTTGHSVATVVLTAGSAGSARLRVSSDGISYSNLAEASTAGTTSYSFTIFLRKDYYYYVEVTRTAGGGADPTANIKYYR